MDDNNFGVPAGWYPDPLGLPQLRWWDAQAWTEHTSEARAPIIIQPATRLGYADDDLIAEESRAWDDLPSRREQRERERQDSGTIQLDYESDVLEYQPDTVDDELSAQPLLAMTLKELEPPLTDTVDDETPGPRRASSHTNAAPAASTLSALAEEEEAPARAPKRMGTYTAAVWFIALMPAIQLAVSVLLIVTGLGNNYPLYLVVWFAPYLLVIGFAAFDRLVLTLWGHERPASAWWAVLTEPVYLVARALCTYRQTGKGFAPLAAFVGSATAVLAGILVMPGLVIAAIPGAFSAEVASSVQADAAALGATFTVECPAPPLQIGETFACIGTKADGTWDSISVRLTRQSGWIDWRVEDWGPAIMVGN
ncbi:MAG TPA: DUF2510 domain-containing protein [Rhodoglobus sp.]|nr:DUF2510 domain-containing protein [Rhodoglobus sp.]